MYYLNDYPEKYLHLKHIFGYSFWLNIPQFRAEELESSVYFLVACLQSAMGRILEFSHRKIVR